MALTEKHKKLLIGGGIGALALAVGFGIFGGKAAASPGQPALNPPPQQRDLARKRKKRHHDDKRGDRDENNRGEYGSKKHKRHRHGD